MAQDFAGFTAQDIAADFGNHWSPAVIQALIDFSSGGQLTPVDQKALATLPPGSLQELQQVAGDPNTGFQHLAEHPKGSHYSGDFNPTDTLANIATGGLYGLGKAAYGGVSGQQDLFGAAKSGLNQLGPYGSATYNIPGYGPQIAQTGNLIGAGAGIGAGGFGSGGFGTATPTNAYYAGADDFIVNVPGGGVGAFQPGAEGGVHMFDPVSGGFAGAGVGGAASGGAGSATLGALTAQQLGGLLGGQSPLALPQQGAAPGGGVGTGGLTPAQVAALSAMNSEAHRGLAPSFESRMRGMQQSPGIAGSAFIQ